MEVKKCRVASLLLLIVFLASQEMLSRGEERQCGSKSQLFRGLCKNATCRVVCKHEGFENGFCQIKWFFFLNRKCICQKTCTAGAAAKEVANSLPLDYSTNPQTTGLGRYNQRESESVDPAKERKF